MKSFTTAAYLQDWNGNNHPLGERDHPVRYVSWYAAMAYAVVGRQTPTDRSGMGESRTRWIGQKAVSVGQWHII